MAGLLGLFIGLAACEQTTAVPREPDGPTFTAEPLPPLVSPCPSQRGMVGVPFPDGSCYLMDAWPVTRGEYFDALAQGPLQSTHWECRDDEPATGPREGRLDATHETGGLGNLCLVTTAWDDIAQLDVRVDNRLPWPPSEAERDDPMTCITWCDAHAYCDRVGKRLCNQRTLTETDLYDHHRLVDVENDEFFNACTAGGTRASPTGQDWPVVTFERVRRRASPSLTYIESRGVRRAELQDGGEGPYQGLWGISVRREVSGPVYPSIRSEYFDPDVGAVPLFSACGALQKTTMPVRIQPIGPHPFVRFSMFRCCADPE